MAFQFCTNDFYLYAQTGPADPGQTQVTNESESEPSDSTGEAAEETPPSDTGTPEPSAPVEEQPAAPVEEQPGTPVEEQREVASTLKVEFVDANNASVKETVEQALTSKYVKDTINLDELGIDINVEGYTLTEVKDKNDNTQVYTTETKDFVLTGNVTKLQFVYTQNVQTDQPEDSQEPSTPQGGQEDQNSEEDQEDTDDEDSDSQTNEGEDESADSSKDDELAYPEQILSETASDGAIITIIAKEGALPEGAEVVVEPVESDSVAQIVEDALSQEGKELLTYKAYDITILLDGEEIQPKVPIRVGITGSGVTGSEKSLFHIADGSSKADKVSVIDSGNTQTFSAEGFSIYVVTGSGSGQGTISNRYQMNVNDTVNLAEDYLDTGGTWSVTSGESIIRIERQSGGHHPWYGWRTNPSATILALKEGDATVTYKESGRQGDTHDFYIHVSEDDGVYTVRFDANGGEGNSITWDVKETNITLPTAEELGFSNGDKLFIGWSTDRTGKGNTFISGVQFPDNSNHDAVLTEDETLYAIWLDLSVESDNEAYFYIRKDGGIAFEPAGYGTDLYYPLGSAKTLKGELHQPIAINNNLTAVEANLKIKPTNEQIQSMLSGYGVSYDPSTQYVQWYVIKYRETNEGKTYWNVDGVIRNIAEYSVTYNPNGGNANVPSSIQYQPQTEVNVDFSTIPSRAGYEFLGWSEDKNAVNPTYTENGTNSFTMPANDVTLYAVWKEKDNVTINYKAIGGGRVLPESESLRPATGSAKGSTAQANSGYKFVGWFDNAECTGEPLSTDSHFAPFKDVDELWTNTTYYAKFEQKKGKVQYNLVEGEWSLEDWETNNNGFYIDPIRYEYPDEFVVNSTIPTKK